MATTAMQDMLSYIRSTLPMDLDWPRMLEAKAEELLEKEKEQIIEAHGIRGWYKPDTKESGVMTGEDYYNQNYSNE